MRSLNLAVNALFLTLAMMLAMTLGCARQAPDVTRNVRQALDAAGLSSVNVSQDRAKNVVTLSGNVATDNDKARAESVAKTNAGDAVIADEIAIRPAGEESTARKVDAELDSGIDKNLEAKLVQHRLNHDVKYDVSEGVVTLKGNVPSRSERDSAEKLAQQVPNVKQVVNELEVKGQKATSTK